MKIIIAGGSGFLGRALAAALLAEGHEVVVLTRGRPDSPDSSSRSSASSGGDAAVAPPGRARPVVWSPSGEAGRWSSELERAGAVINLAGESIAGKRWSAAHKRRILDSRLDATRSLVDAIRR